MLRDSGLAVEKDYIYFLDSTQARFWFFNEAAKEKITDFLRTVPDGRVLSDKDYEALYFHFADRKYGELIVVINDGVGIFPNFFQHETPCKGLHGYLPEVEGNWAQLIITGCNINKTFTDPVEMVDLFPTLLNLLDYDKPEDMKANPFSS